MLGIGRGDRLTPTAGPRARWVVLVVPPFGISTKEAFAWWDAAHVGLRGQTPANDLQSVVVRRYPEIAQIVTALKKVVAPEAAISCSVSAGLRPVGHPNSDLGARGQKFPAGSPSNSTR